MKNSLIFIMVVLFLIILYLILDRYKMKNKIKILKTSLDITNEKIEKNRKENYFLNCFRHDYRSHMIILLKLLDEKEYIALYEYIQELCIVDYINKKEEKSGNIIIDAVIEECISIYDEVKFMCSGDVIEKTGITDFELGIVFSNLIKNAFQAAKKNKKNSFVSLNIRKTYNGYFLCLKNSCKNIKTNRIIPGLGINNINRIISKNCCLLKYNIKKEVVETEIFIPFSL